MAECDIDEELEILALEDNAIEGGYIGDYTVELGGATGSSGNRPGSSDDDLSIDGRSRQIYKAPADYEDANTLFGPARPDILPYFRKGWMVQ